MDGFHLWLKGVVARDKIGGVFQRHLPEGCSSGCLKFDGCGWLKSEGPVGQGLGDGEWIVVGQSLRYLNSTSPNGF